MSAPAPFKDFQVATAKPAANVKRLKPKAPPPLTIRLTHDERARLERDAGALSMAAYARLRLFADDDAPKRRRVSRKKQMLSSELSVIGALLGELGNSGLAASLADLAGAAKVGALPVSDEVEADVIAACAAVQEMRVRLIGALGVKSR